MRARLYEEMEARPLVKSPFSVVPSPYFSWVSPRALVPLVAVLVIIGGGSAYAAEGTVPGDLLYSIKRGVNEPLRQALALSAQAKAHGDARGSVIRQALNRRIGDPPVLGLVTLERGRSVQSALS